MLFTVPITFKKLNQFAVGRQGLHFFISFYIIHISDTIITGIANGCMISFSKQRTLKIDFSGTCVSREIKCLVLAFCNVSRHTRRNIDANRESFQNLALIGFGSNFTVMKHRTEPNSCGKFKNNFFMDSDKLICLCRLHTFHNILLHDKHFIVLVIVIEGKYAQCETVRPNTPNDGWQQNNDWRLGIALPTPVLNNQLLHSLGYFFQILYHYVKPFCLPASFWDWNTTKPCFWFTLFLRHHANSIRCIYH